MSITIENFNTKDLIGNEENRIINKEKNYIRIKQKLLKKYFSTVVSSEYSSISLFLVIDGDI